MPDRRRRLVDVTLDGGTLAELSPDSQQERDVALFDLRETNSFALVGHESGPYRLRIGLHDQRLVLDVRSEADHRVREFRLALKPLRSLIRDYFTVCDAYYEAIRTASPSRIEAIDMGRRGLHNEGAEALKGRLADKITIDEATARRLFTVICALHPRN